MKIRSFLLALLIIMIPLLLIAQDAQYPIVKDFGGIYEVADSIKPDTAINYKIVIDLKTEQPNKDQINSGLNNVARMMNLHGLGGVKPENLHVTVVVHGGATEIILNNKAYQKKNEVDNPNLELIEALKEADAELYVCGQSLLARGYKLGDVNSEVTIGLSMLTVVTEHMHEGYKLLVFD